MNRISCAEACYASKVKRFFGGYIIDKLVCQLPVYLAFTYYLTDKFPIFSKEVDLYALAGVEIPSGMAMPQTPMLTVGDYAETLAVALFMLVYYFVMEAICSRTLAKYMLGTVVVDKDGNKPSIWRILLRSVCRFIPFDAISFLFASWYDGRMYGAWHDKLSGTYVVETMLLEQWQQGTYDGSDKLGAIVRSMMQDSDVVIQEKDEVKEESQDPGRLRVEDLYPSDEADDQGE